jgi:hypothetical protein
LKLKRDLIVAQETLSKIGSVCKVRSSRNKIPTFIRSCLSYPFLATKRFLPDKSSIIAVERRFGSSLESREMV